MLESRPSDTYEERPQTCRFASGVSAPATPTSAAQPVLEVAVGVVFRDDGAVLFGQRLAGKPYAGWWEFPGGKLEAGESVEQALSRELHEELGLTVIESVPWVVREFNYPHAHVRLHFQRVTRYLGEPQSREGQQLRWQPIAALDVQPILPAALPVIEWLRLPMQICSLSAEALAKILAQPDRLSEVFTEPTRSMLLLTGLEGVDIAETGFQNMIQQLSQLTEDRGWPLVLQTDAELAASGGVGNPQIPWGGQLWSRQRLVGRHPVDARNINGLACSDRIEIDQAADLGFDWVIVDRSVGVAARGALARITQLPLFVFERNLARARTAGAHGIIREL